MIRMKKTSFLLIIAAVVAVCCIVTAGCVQTAGENGIVPTDYSNPVNWMIQEKTPSQEVDLIYFYPTAAKKATGDGFIAEITDEMKETAQGSFMSQGSAFAEYCNVFVPYYRQIAMDNLSQMGNRSVILDALRTSAVKTDVFAALDYYFKNCNNGRPFILAGHSQGSAMILIALEEYMKQHPEYLKNMVVAYAIGWGVDQAWLDANPHLKFAQGEKDTGVIVSWNTEKPGATKPSILLGKGVRVINPITWTTDETHADKSLNKGSIVNTENATVTMGGLGVYDTESTIQSKLNDAQIDTERGALICTTSPESALPANCCDGVFGDSSMHSADYALYYTNIRENGYERIASFLGYYPLVGIPMDYSNDANWMFKETDGKYPVDLFYVYPTADMESTKLVTEVDANNDAGSSSAITLGSTLYKFRTVDVPTPEVKAEAHNVYNISGVAFEGYTNVFAPYYHQVPLERAVECISHNDYIDQLRGSRARTDMFAALDYYFENLNKGAQRPFILASHSQGSAMSQVILDEYMKEHPEYYKNMVAAYVLGYGTEQAWLDANPHLKFATGEDDTGVVVSWNTEGPGAKQYSMLLGENSKVINPLTWTSDETYADKSLNKGSMVIAADGSVSIVPGLHDAQIDAKRGTLICTTDTAYLTSVHGVDVTDIFAEKSLHGDDYRAYFENIRENGQKRIDAFFAQKKESD